MAVFAFVVMLCINTPSGLLGVRHVRGRALGMYKNSGKAFVDKSFFVCWYTVCSPLRGRRSSFRVNQKSLKTKEYDNRCYGNLCC